MSKLTPEELDYWLYLLDDEDFTYIDVNYTVENDESQIDIDYTVA